MTTIMTASRQWATRPSDERFASLLDLNARMDQVRAESRATVCSSRRIHVAPQEGDDMKGIQITGPNGHAYNPTHHAFGQLAQLAGAPANYLRTLPAPLVADAMNYGFGVSRDVEDVGVLLQRNGENLLRAATGPNYGRVWNNQLSGELVRRFGDGVSGQWKVPGEFGKAVKVNKDNTTLYASDRDMFVFLCDETNRIEIPGRRDGVVGSFARGFFVWNSEVGSTSLGAAFFLFDYVCSNRIVWGARDYKEIRIRHTSGAPDRWLDEVQPVLTQYAEASAKPIVQAITDARQQRIEGKAAEWLAKRYTKAEALGAMKAHEAEEGRPIETVWDAVTGLTAYAKKFQNTNDRVDVERKAGKLLAA